MWTLPDSRSNEPVDARPNGESLRKPPNERLDLRRRAGNAPVPPDGPLSSAIARFSQSSSVSDSRGLAKAARSELLASFCSGHSTSLHATRGNGHRRHTENHNCILSTIDYYIRRRDGATATEARTHQQLNQGVVFRQFRVVCSATSRLRSSQSTINYAKMHERAASNSTWSRMLMSALRNRSSLAIATLDMEQASISAEQPFCNGIHRML